MRKFIIAMLLCLGMAGSCCAEAVNVVATIFPIYDWVREISKGAEHNITLLLDDGVDLHSYQPTVEDIVNISPCDMFVYIGGESDEWAKGILSGTHNPKRIVINLLEVLG